MGPDPLAQMIATLANCGIAWRDLQSLPTFCQGSLRIPCPLERKRQVNVGVCKFRVEPDGGLELFQGFSKSALLEKHGANVVMSERRVRLGLRGVVILRQRAIPIACKPKIVT